MAIVSTSSAAANTLTWIARPATDTTESRIPMASASSGGTTPRGMGRIAVRAILASMSASHHMLSAPHAPAPAAIAESAATNSVSAGPIAMFLVIFLWTPPHFWALALCRSGDYERVGVPMLPNVAGPVKTCRQIVAYSVLLIPASLGPLAIQGVGLLHGAVAVAADAGLLWRALALYRLREGDESARRKAAMGLFGYSILYLFILFAAMLAEVMLRAHV